MAADEHRERSACGEIALNEALERVALLLDLDLLLHRVDRRRNAGIEARLRDAADDFGVLEVLPRGDDPIADHSSWKYVEVAVPSVFIATSAACASRDS